MIGSFYLDQGDLNKAYPYLVKHQDEMRDLIETFPETVYYTEEIIRSLVASARLGFIGGKQELTLKMLKIAQHTLTKLMASTQNERYDAWDQQIKDDMARMARGQEPSFGG